MITYSLCLLKGDSTMPHRGIVLSPIDFIAGPHPPNSSDIDIIIILSSFFPVLHLLLPHPLDRPPSASIAQSPVGHGDIYQEIMPALYDHPMVPCNEICSYNHLHRTRMLLAIDTLSCLLLPVI